MLQYFQRSMTVCNVKCVCKYMLSTFLGFSIFPTILIVRDKKFQVANRQDFIKYVDFK